MLESHGNISIFRLTPQTWFWTSTVARMRVKQTELNEIGAQ